MSLAAFSFLSRSHFLLLPLRQFPLCQKTENHDNDNDDNHNDNKAT